MGKKVGRKISKNYSQIIVKNFLSATGAIKTASKREIQNTSEVTGDLIGNKISDKVTNVSKTSPQNNSETAINEYNKEILKERYITPEQRQKIWSENNIIV